MQSLVLSGPAVRPAICNIQTDKQTDRHNAFYMLDYMHALQMYYCIESDDVNSHDLKLIDTVPGYCLDG